MFIQTQLDNQRYNLNLWEKVIKNAIDVKAKTSLQLPSKIKKINFKYLRGYRLAKKDEINRDYWKNRDKNKSTQNFTPANNINQFQAQTSKKNKNKCY